MDLLKSYQILDKMRLFHEKLETTNYVMNNYYAEAYLNKIRDKSDPEVCQMFGLPFEGYLTRMLSDGLILCENYHISVRIFFIKLLGHICNIELAFVKVFAQSSEYIKKCFKDIQSPSMNQSLRLAFLELATSIIDHGSGLEWLMETGVWKGLVTLENNKRTLFVDRHLYKFVCKFMWKLNDIGDIDNMNLALKAILAPLEDMRLNSQVLTNECETEICNKIEPMCHMLSTIFAEKDRIGTSSQLMRCVLTDSFFNKIAACIIKLQTAETVLACTKILCWATWANIFQLKPLLPGVVYTKEDLLGHLGFYYHTLTRLIQRRNVKLILEFSSSCTVIWNNVWQKSTPFTKDDNKNLEMQSQMMSIVVVPLLTWMAKVRLFSEVVEDEVVVKNIAAMMNNAHVTHTMRAFYAIRSIIFEDDLNIIETAILSLKSLNSLKLLLTDEVATLLFRCLFYILREYDKQESKPLETDGPRSDSKIITMMSLVLEILQSVVKHYNITWNESVEVLNLYSVVNGILKKPNLPPKFVVVLLTTLSYSVKKFLTPNLSLLLKSAPGCEVHEIGSLINLKMNDEEWEVRDSALELLYVCTDLCFIKHPGFQKQIIDEKLVVSGARLAFTDSESYVQAIALRVLCAAARVPRVWAQLCDECHVQEHLLSTLQQSSDGAVRKESCSVLCEVYTYQHDKMTSSDRSRLYQHMASAALTDCYWEVQLEALHFWSKVIKTLLTDQGMLDGTFPKVTFSKQSRKIVALNTTEIQRRLTHVLDELSTIGCLTVLVKLLNEDSHIEIMELALNISLELNDILDNYKVPESLSSNEVTSVEDLTIQIIDDEEAMEVVTSASETADNVIDDILTANDVNLISKIYDMNLDSESFVKPKIRLSKLASPKLFVEYVKSKDFKDIIDQKKQWKDGRRSLSELLDDLLGYEYNEEVNSLDCY